MSGFRLTRRGLVLGGGGLLLASCDKLTTAPSTTEFLRRNGEAATYGWQRLIQNNERLAREYTIADLSPVFKANGSTDPDDDDYLDHVDENFENWTLKIDGLVTKPRSNSA